MSSVLEYGYRAISVEEYHRMIEAGVFPEDERLELLEGVIVPMSPQSRKNAYAIQWLANALPRMLGADHVVLPQLPLTLSDRSEPEPDLAVVRAEDARSRDRHPHTAALVIEVALESLRKDRLLKASLYARAGIPEYWIVNLDDECVEGHHDPNGAAGRYSSVLIRKRGEEVHSSVVPGVRIRIDDLFGGQAS